MKAMILRGSRNGQKTKTALKLMNMVVKNWRLKRTWSILKTSHTLINKTKYKRNMKIC